MLMDLFLQLRGTIYDRGDKLHFNERQIPFYFKLQISPSCLWMWGLKVEAEVLGAEGLGADWLHREEVLSRASCFSYSRTHLLFFRECLWPPFMEEETEVKRCAKTCPKPLWNFRSWRVTLESG